MIFLGCHLSAAKGFRHLGLDALQINADTFQFFTRNPRGGNSRAWDEVDVEALREIIREHHFGPLVAHAPYTMNASAADPALRDFARNMMIEDLRNLDGFLPGNLYNFHPGCHVGQGIERGSELVVELLNAVLKHELKTTVLLETMSGKGSEIGSKFEELRWIIDRVSCPEKLGVCLDTCHVYSAGYDLVGDLDGVLGQFDAIIGLDRLKAIHLNDSMTPFASHKDRHAKIGKGSLGESALERLVTCPVLQGLPFCLETPNELSGYSAEIAALRQVLNSDN